ncbi:MAG: alpha-amylase family glycosyl hydrolase [Bdellovibrionaceae bacterium]|nr:alpha-amylase family glycosyl hydrolase [Pseudobdellovibrionaceae bacterium]
MGFFNRFNSLKALAGILLGSNITLEALTFSYEGRRTVAVQFFQWSWESIARECETYLGPYGFAAALVPPPHEHIVRPYGPWWERYQIVSYQLYTRSGSEVAFRNMIARCKKAGVDIYADMVLNHMAGFVDGVGFWGSPFTHFEYPGVWERKHFNNCGRHGDNIIRNFKDKYELQYCQLLNLADLATGSEQVRTRLRQEMERLSEMGVAGFRIDAAKHIPTQDIRAITSGLSKKPYIFQELIISPGDPVTYAEYAPNGDMTFFAFPYLVGKSFKDRELELLTRLPSIAIPSDLAIVFIDNHDLQRMEDRSWLVSYQRDGLLFRWAQVFLLTYPYGYPFLLSGYFFQNFDEGPPLEGTGFIKEVVFKRDGSCEIPWSCEHRLPEIPFLVYFRNKLDSQFYVSRMIFHEKNQLIFQRGNNNLVAFNLHETKSLDLNLAFYLEKGNYCYLLLSSKTENTKYENPLCPNQMRIHKSSHWQLPPQSVIVLLRVVNVDQKK